MAKGSKSQQTSSFKVKSKVTRPGVHSKKNTSGLKTSINYVKQYRGQGR